MLYDQQFQLANAVAKSISDATASALQASTAFWTGAKAPDPARSWYRAPAPNPFDWSSWAMPGNAASGPWNAWGASFNPMLGMPMMSAGAQPWSALATFASAMAAMQPMQSYWAPFAPASQPAMPGVLAWQAMMWPMMAQFNAVLAAAASNSAVFANYRSPGGHATAQVTFAEQPTSDWRSNHLH